MIEGAPKFPSMQAAAANGGTAAIGIELERYSPDTREDGEKSDGILNQILNVIRFASGFKSHIRQLLSQSFR